MAVADPLDTFSTALIHRDPALIVELLRHQLFAPTDAPARARATLASELEFAGPPVLLTIDSDSPYSPRSPSPRSPAPHSPAPHSPLAQTSEGPPTLALAVQIPLEVDPSAPVRWDAHEVRALTRLGCPVRTVVVSPTPSVCRWVARLRPSHALPRPLIIDQGRVPRIRNLSTVARRPCLALLSVVMHAHDDREVAATTLLGLRRLEPTPELDAGVIAAWSAFILTYSLARDRAYLERVLEPVDPGPG